MPEHEPRPHLRYRRTSEHTMPTGTKIAAIVCVILLGAAGLYYAFVAPSASNQKSTAARESGAPSTSTSVNGLSSQTPTTLVPPIPSVGAQPSAASATPAVGSLGSTPGTAVAVGQPGGMSPSPTGLPAGTGSTAGRPQPGFAPGSLGAQGTGKGDLPAGSTAANPLGTTVPTGARPAPAQAAPVGATVNGFPAGAAGTVPAVTATPASGTAGPTPTGITVAPGSPRPTGAGAPTTASSPTTAPTSATPVVGATGERTHTVASGETLSSIARKYLGSEKSWRAIAKANPTVDPSALKIGTKLKIPASGGTETKVAAKPQAESGVESGTAGSSASSASGSSEGTHVVASGDTLASIARKYYGSTKYWERLYKENRGLIGANPAALKIGQKLKVPAKTVVVSGENTTR